MRSIILSVVMSLILIACSHTPSENIASKQKSGWFMSPQKIAVDKYVKLRKSGMDHNSALIILRRYERRVPSKVNAFELRKEIDQRIAMFCFQEEAYKLYKSDRLCKKQGELAYKQCEVENFGHHDRSLIGCIDRKLKSGEKIAINGIR